MLQRRYFLPTESARPLSLLNRTPQRRSQIKMTPWVGRPWGELQYHCSHCQLNKSPSVVQQNGATKSVLKISCPEKGGPLKRLRARSTRAGSAAKQWQGRDTRSSVGRDTVPMHLARSPEKIGSLSKRQRPMPRNRGLRTTDLSNCLKKSACSVRFNFSIRFCYLFHTLSFS